MLLILLPTEHETQWSHQVGLCRTECGQWGWGCKAGMSVPWECWERGVQRECELGFRALGQYANLLLTTQWENRSTFEQRQVSMLSLE